MSALHPFRPLVQCSVSMIGVVMTDAIRPPLVRGSSCMSDNNKLLSAALVAFGAAFCLIYPLAMFWPSGWAWHEGSPAANDYFLMIVGVYATLGIFMIRAAKVPAAN